MQVGQADRADLRDGKMPLERSECTTAEIEDQVEVLGSHQIARGGRVRPGNGPGTAEHGELHTLKITGGLPASQENASRRGTPDRVAWQ
jgi:hypothetical protein